MRMSIQSSFRRLEFLRKILVAREIGDWGDDELLQEYFKLRLRLKGY